MRREVRTHFTSTSKLKVCADDTGLHQGGLSIDLSVKVGEIFAQKGRDGHGQDGAVLEKGTETESGQE